MSLTPRRQGNRVFQGKSLLPELVYISFFLEFQITNWKGMMTCLQESASKNNIYNQQLAECPNPRRELFLWLSLWPPRRNTEGMLQSSQRPASSLCSASPLLDLYPLQALEWISSLSLSLCPNSQFNNVRF